MPVYTKGASILRAHLLDHLLSSFSTILSGQMDVVKLLCLSPSQWISPLT